MNVFIEICNYFLAIPDLQAYILLMRLINPFLFLRWCYNTQHEIQEACYWWQWFFNIHFIFLKQCHFRFVLLQPLLKSLLWFHQKPLYQLQVVCVGVWVYVWVCVFVFSNISWNGHELYLLMENYVHQVAESTRNIPVVLLV